MNGIRFISYNLLSSSLRTSNSFPETAKAHLDPFSRLDDILVKFRNILAESKITSTGRSAVIFGLQEVSLKWEPRLRTFFDSHAYEFISSCYGNRFNGYMGVAIAFPRQTWDNAEEHTVLWDGVDAIEIVCPPQEYGEAGFKQWKKAQKEADSVWYRRVARFGRESLPFRPLLDKLSPRPLRPPQTMIAHRFNRAIFGVMEHADLGPIAVGTYHMPCMFKYPEVMAVHALLFFHALHVFCVKNNLRSFVVMMDANFEPGSLPYRTIMNTITDEERAAIDAVNPGVTRLTVPAMLESGPQSLSSFLKNLTHVYPDDSISNHTIGFAGSFTGKIDYIWYTPVSPSTDGKVVVRPDTALAPLEKADAQPSYLPNAIEPSDHYMLAASMTLVT